MSTLDPNMKPALLVVDVQNAWLDNTAELKESVEKRLNVINGGIGWFRKNKHPVIVIYHEEPEIGVMPGTNAFEFSRLVQIEEQDIRVTKRYSDAFNRTNLDSVLRSLGRDTVLIVGLSASGCALATYFGAKNYDYNSFLVKGGVASHDQGHVRFAEEICETMAVDEFDRRLR